VLGEELADPLGDERTFLLEGDVPRVEQVQLGVREVAQEAPGAVGAEDLVVLAPDEQRRRPAVAEVLLEGGVPVEVEPVVVEEIELDLPVALAVEAERVQGGQVGGRAAWRRCSGRSVRRSPGCRR
jgi:hypothetical protein